MKVRLVLRESNETLKEGYGFANQKDDCLKFVAKHEFEVVKEHQLVESSIIWNREKFEEIIDQVIRERDEIPVIIFSRVDRFARNQVAAGHYLFLLRQAGLTVIFAQEDLIVDSEASGMKVLMFFIHSFKADQDGKQLKHNLLGGRDKLATEAHEVPNGMVMWPFDYMAKRLYGKINTTGRPTLNAERVTWVRRWADWIIEEGIGIGEVCRRTNEASVLTRRNGKFWIKAIRDILRSRQLIGEFQWKGKLYLEDENLRILTVEQFKALQKILDENSERSYYNAAKLDYPPLPKMVFHSCGHLMYGVPQKRKPYYRCPKCRKSCFSATALWDEIRQGIQRALLREDWLISQIRTQFDSKDVIERLEQAIEAKGNEIRKLEKSKDKAFRMGMVLDNYPAEKVQEQIDQAETNIQRLKMEKVGLEKRLQTLKEQMVNEGGIRRFCQLAKDNIESLTKNQWQLLNKLLKLKITVYTKELITVNMALPPVRDTQIEFSRL